MKLTSFLKNALFMLGLIILASCTDKKDDPKNTPDITKPEIQIEVPGENATVDVGGSLPLTVRFTDNVGLSQALVDVHFNDGHGHGKVSPWDTSFTVSLSGNDQTVTKNIYFPKNIAAGEYHVILNCLDASGNKADEKEIELSVTAEGQPFIDDVKVDNSSTNGDIEINLTGKSDVTKTLSARVTAKSLDSVFVVIYQDAERSSATSSFQYQKKFGLGGKSTFDLNEAIKFETSKFEKGTHYYVAYIRAIETSGHNRVKEVSLKIVN